jgi:endonuclease/exonuclease/phosphatase family metal-dependent hydrolase
VLSVQELTPDGLARLDAAGAAEALPGRATEPAFAGAGSGLLARRALRPAPRRAAPGARQPEAVLAVRGAPPVRVKAVHPLPPISSENAREWRDALRALPGSDGRGDVRIIAGDFNATLDHRELRRVLDRGYTDAADAAGGGLTSTWAGRGRATRRLPITIDHVLVDRRVAVRDVIVERVRGTDHRMLIARLVLPAAGQAR